MSGAFYFSEFSLVLTVDLQLAIVHSPYLVIHPLSLGLPRMSGRLPKAVTRNDRMYVVKVGSCGNPMM